MRVRRFRHRSVRYIWNRSRFFWDQKRNAGDPWLTRQSIEILDELLLPTDRGIEWGSGRSTIWFARRVAHLLSIESNLKWLEIVRGRLKEESLRNVSCVFHPIHDRNIFVATHPYVHEADAIPDESLDFGLVDGHFRDLCAVVLASKLRPGGILVIDNIERYLPSTSQSPEAIGQHVVPATKVWSDYVEMVSSWRKIWTSNGVIDTCIWFKPC